MTEDTTDLSVRDGGDDAESPKRLADRWAEIVDELDVEVLDEERARKMAYLAQSGFTGGTTQSREELLDRVERFLERRDFTRLGLDNQESADLKEALLNATERGVSDRSAATPIATVEPTANRDGWEEAKITIAPDEDEDGDGPTSADRSSSGETSPLYAELDPSIEDPTPELTVDTDTEIPSAGYGGPSTEKMPESDIEDVLEDSETADKSSDDEVEPVFDTPDEDELDSILNRTDLEIDNILRKSDHPEERDADESEGSEESEASKESEASEDSDT